MIEKLKEQIEIHPYAVIAHGPYDHEFSLKFIIQKLKAKPAVALNLRREKHKEYKLSRKEIPICIAAIEMICWGRFLDRGIVRLKHVCPLPT